MTTTFNKLVSRLDKNATYFWVRKGVEHRLLNKVSYKTALGGLTRWEARRLHEALKEAGFELEEFPDGPVHTEQKKEVIA